MFHRPALALRRSPALRFLLLLGALAIFVTACSGTDSPSDDSVSESGVSGESGESSDSDVGETSDGIAAAATPAPPDESELEIARGGEITVGIVAESTGWFPPSAEVATSAGFLVMDALYDRWFEQTDAGDIVPMLAAEPATANADASEWTVVIRPGAFFHDGTPIDAQAAADMITIWHEGPFADSVPVVSTDVIDEYTITYVLNEPDPAFDQTLTGRLGAVFSPTAARAFGLQDSAENPIGSGPFMLESWTRDSETVVVRNPNYWRPAPDGGTLPYLDRIRFRVLPDGTARRAALAAGDLDIMTQAGVDGGAALVDQGFVPYEHIGDGAGLNIYNTVVPPFDDVRVRRAAAHAVNMEDHVALRAPNLSGVLEVRTQYYNSASPWFDEQAHELAATFDLDEAQRLHDDYVADPARSDGKAAGDPISFTYDCSADPTNLDTAQLFQQQWQDIGFEVDLRTTESAAFISKVIGVTSDPVFQGDFQIACWADAPGGDPLPAYVARYGEGRVENWTNFTHPDIDAALVGLRTSIDFDERKEFAGQIARITAREQAEFWWASGASLVLTTPEVHGLETYTFPDGEAGDRRDSGRVWWPEVWIDGAAPLADVPTGFVEIPDVPVEEDEPETAVAPNPDVAAAMPEPPEEFSVTDDSAPVTSLCDDVDPIGDVEPLSATHQNYAKDPTLGPFGLISIYELTEADADAVVAAYAAAVDTCTDFTTTTADGSTLTGDFLVRDLGSYGDESYAYGMPASVSGLGLDFDFVLIRSGNNVAVVVTTVVFVPSDGTLIPPFAQAAADLLAGLG